MRDLLSEKDNLAVRYVVQAIEVMLRIRAGDFEVAEGLAADCRQQDETAGDADSVGWHAAHLVTLRWYQGMIVDLLPSLRELVNSPTLSAVDNSFVCGGCAGRRGRR